MIFLFLITQSLLCAFSISSQGDVFCVGGSRWTFSWSLSLLFESDEVDDWSCQSMLEGAFVCLLEVTFIDFVVTNDHADKGTTTVEHSCSSNFLVLIDSFALDLMVSRLSIAQSIVDFSSLHACMNFPCVLYKQYCDLLWLTIYLIDDRMNWPHLIVVWLNLIFLLLGSSCHSDTFL